MRHIYSLRLATILVAVLTVTANSAQQLAPDLRGMSYDQRKASGLLTDGGASHSEVVQPTVQQQSKKPVNTGSAKGGSGGTCDCWVTPDATWNLAMAPNDDGSSATIFLPFTFNLYGDLYTSCNINNNGNVTFGCGMFGGFTAGGFPAATAGAYCVNMVAPFWADVDTRPAGGGEVWYKVTPTAMYVNWVAVGYYSMMTDKLNSFSLIITDGTDPVIGIGKNVSFCYGDMQWTTGAASGGTMGFGGTAANVGCNRGNGIDYIQFTRPDQAGAFYDGPFALNDGIDWLDNKSFIFTTSVSTSNIPPIGNSVYLCDTIDVCVGQQVTFDFTFLSPEPAQTTTASAYSSFGNFAIITNTPGNTAFMTVQFTPQPGEVGFQTITFEGTDNGAPALTATYNIVANVFPAPATAAGSATVCSNDPVVDLFPLMSPPLASGGDWTDPGGNVHNGIFNPAVDPPGNYNYAVGGGAGCPSTATIAMTVVTAPNAGTNGVLATCNSNPPTDLFPLLGGSPDAGGSWTAPGGLPFTNPLDPAVNGTGAYLYTVLGTTPCANDQSQVNVNVATAVDAGDNATVDLCFDATPLNMLASLAGTPDATGGWFTPGGAPFGGTFNASVDPEGVYLYVTPAIAPCEPDSSWLTINVQVAPDAGVDVNLTLCANAPNIALFPLLGGSPDAGGAWIDPNGAGFSGIVDPSTELSGDYTYVAYGVGECDHLTDTSIVVTALNHMPEAAFSALPLGGCDDLEVTFANETPAAQVGTCDWSFGDGGSGSNTSASFTYTYNNPGVYDVSLTVTSPEGCVTTVSTNNYIQVTPAPFATFDPFPNPTSVEAPTVVFTATDPYAITWAWTIEGLDSTQNQQEFSFDFPDVLGDVYEVCLHVTDQWGCEDTQCQDIEVRDPLLVFVPNSFSPNGDGVNDWFFPSIIGDDPTAFHMYIYDRWGEKVYESTDRNNVWIGTMMNSGGELLPNGVYAWRLLTKLDEGGKKEFMGHVTLVK